MNTDTATTAAPDTLVTVPATKTGPRVLADAFELRKALALIKPAIPTRGYPLPALGGVRMVADATGVHLTGSDLELTITVGLEQQVVERHGVAIIPFGQLTQLVASATAKKSPGVSIDVDRDEADVKLANRNRMMRLLPNDEYPRLAAPNADDPMHMLDTSLLAAVLPAISTDDARPILTGMLIGGEEGKIVGTDSYRLYAIDGPVLAKPILVPGRAIKEAVKAGGTTTMSVGEREVRFEWPDRQLRIVTRLIEGEFPNWRGLVPASQPIGWTFTKPEQLLEACKASDKFGEPNTPIRVSPLPEGGFECITIVQDVGMDRFVIDGHADTDEELCVAFNPGYFGAAVKDFPCDELTLGLVDAQKPGVFRGDNGAIRLLMPVRVS